jgi:broad specificity phosphatase PhoE
VSEHRRRLADVAPKPKHQLAREHLERALPAVAADDYTEAVTYEGEEPDLAGESLEDLAARVEAAVEQAEAASR